MNREFYVPSCPLDLPEYHSLTDPHLQHYWCYPSVQRHLRKAGLLDISGAPIDMEKFRSKERIVAKEWERLDLLNRRREERARLRAYSEQVRTNRDSAERRRKADVAAFRKSIM